MINMKDIMETVQMIEEEHLDIRTITMGISLLSCCDPDIDRSCQKVYDKITTYAKNLVQVGEQIEAEYGIPIINKRISVTPIAMLVAASGGDPVKYALTLDRAAKEVGVNFIGGYSALVHKGFAAGDKELLMRQSMEAGFAMDDVVLFLDTHPENQDALRYYKPVRDMRDQSMAAYERRFGPLRYTDVTSMSWNWVTEKWPWEGGC